MSILKIQSALHFIIKFHSLPPYLIIMLQYKRTREKGKSYTVYQRALSDYIQPEIDNAVLNNLHHYKCIKLTIIAVLTTG